MNLRWLIVALFLLGYTSAVFCSNPLVVSTCWALVQLQSSFGAHRFLPEETQWGALSKSKPWLGGTFSSDPRGQPHHHKIVQGVRNPALQEEGCQTAQSSHASLEWILCYREGQMLYVTPFLLVTGSSCDCCSSFFHQDFSWFIILSVY